MILAAGVKWVAGRRVDNYNLQAAYPISYAVGNVRRDSGGWDCPECLCGIVV